MNVKYLKMIFAVTASMVFTGISARAAEMMQSDVHQVPGEIMWVDLQSGQLQVQTDTAPVGDLTEFRIDRDETRVKSDPDNEFLQINDLHPGQDVTVDVVNGNEGKIVQRIITEPRPASDFMEAYGAIGAIDFSSGTFTLVGRQRVSEEEETNVTYFSFDPKNIIVMQSPNRHMDQIEVKSGDVVRIEFVVIDGKRMAHAITVFSPSPEVINTSVTAIASQNNDINSIVGPRGPTGPAGMAGAQGLTGPTGPAGAVLVGEAGAVGPVGPTGEQGFTGPRGQAGDVVRGPMGDVGATGATGAQGAMGQTGQQGNSLNGFTGPVGAAGPQGPQGPIGDAGATGPTTVGPTGPAGYAGSAGEQGAVGDSGPQGITTSGVAGLAGPSGDTGATGAAGEAGDQGAAGRVGNWVSYKEFNFAPTYSALSSVGLEKVSEMASYMKDNPSLQIGIDGIAANADDQDLNDLRVASIQQALINDGVSADRIKIGEFGNKIFRRDGRIPIFFKTA